MDFPPFPGALGERIFQNVSKKAWQAWLEQQKMLVNENRLNLADPEARKYLKEQTENYFFGDGADSAQGFVPVD
jgi:Fe-S cluster biosynthesis and repair protein YggX